MNLVALKRSGGLQGLCRHHEPCMKSSNLAPLKQHPRSKALIGVWFWSPHFAKHSDWAWLLQLSDIIVSTSEWIFHARHFPEESMDVPGCTRTGSFIYFCVYLLISVCRFTRIWSYTCFRCYTPPSRKSTGDGGHMATTRPPPQLQELLI